MVDWKAVRRERRAEPKAAREARAPTTAPAANARPGEAVRLTGRRAGVVKRLGRLEAGKDLVLALMERPPLRAELTRLRTLAVREGGAVREGDDRVDRRTGLGVLETRLVGVSRLVLVRLAGRLELLVGRLAGRLGPDVERLGRDVVRLDRRDGRELERLIEDRTERLLLFFATISFPPTETHQD